MIPQMNYLFAKNATSPTDTGVNPDGTPHICSEPYKNNRCDEITVEISGTFTAASVIFEGKTDVNAPDYTAITAINLSTLDFGTTTTAKGIYAVPIEGLVYMRARIVSVSGGTITILGRAINSAE